LIRAFVLINTLIASENEVLEQVRKVNGVVRAYALYGAWDIIAEVLAKSSDELRRIVVGRIRKIKNVKSTTTLIVIE